MCEKHFSPEWFVFGKGGKRHLSDNAMPSVFPEWPEHMKKSATPKRRILERVSECQHVGDDSSAENEEEEEEEEEGEERTLDSGPDTPVENPSGDGSTSHRSTVHVEHGHGSCGREDVELYVLELEQEVRMLRKRSISLTSMRHDDKELQHYTGFPDYSSFRAVYEYVKPFASKMVYWKGQKNTASEPAISSYPRRSTTLTLEEEFLAVVLRLRTGYCGNDVGKLFGLSPARFSTIFIMWVCLLADCLHELCKLPSSAVTRDTLPSCFSAFPNTRIVIDRTEVFFPTSLLFPSP